MKWLRHSIIQDSYYIVFRFEDGKWMAYYAIGDDEGYT